MGTYGRQNLVFERGEGAWLITAAGDRYLDFASGIAVNVLGHAHPRLIAALTEQAGKLWHTSNLYRVEGQERLAERLVGATFADKVFFCNSGAEACEAAIKAARRYHYVSGNPERWRVIAFSGAFHGRTLATIAAGGNPKYLEGFGPPVEGFDHVPFGDIDAVEQAVGPETAAIMIEPAQGEGGVNVATPEFLRALRALCDKHGLLLIFDEVQCGMGRSGKLFAYEWAGVTPDLMPVAKGIGGGFPLGALLATEDAAKGLTAGTHGSTFGGNPLACAAALATLDAIESENLLENARVRGEAIRTGLRAALSGVHGVVDIRGEGMMIGVELDRPCGELVGVARDAGVLINVTADNVIRLVPPLMYGAAEVDALVAAVSGIVKVYLQQAA